MSKGRAPLISISARANNSLTTDSALDPAIANPPCYLFSILQSRKLKSSGKLHSQSSDICQAQSNSRLLTLYKHANELVHKNHVILQ